MRVVKAPAGRRGSCDSAPHPPGAAAATTHPTRPMQEITLRLSGRQQQVQCLQVHVLVNTQARPVAGRAVAGRQKARSKRDLTGSSRVAPTHVTRSKQSIATRPWMGRGVQGAMCIQQGARSRGIKAGWRH